MKDLREIVGYVTELTGKGKLDAIRQYHVDKFRGAKKRSEEQTYHGLQSGRARRDTIVRDGKDDVTGRAISSREKKDQLTINATTAKRSKNIKKRLDAEAAAKAAKKTRKPK